MGLDEADEAGKPQLPLPRNNTQVGASGRKRNSRDDDLFEYHELDFIRSFHLGTGGQIKCIILLTLSPFPSFLFPLIILPCIKTDST